MLSKKEWPLYLFRFSFVPLLSSCSVQKKISGPAERLLNDPSVKTAHVGISIFEPATNRYWYNFQADKYFVPASNTKLFSCYAAMKYLGDSLLGIRYVDKGNGTVEIEANGDPSFLHPNFKTHRVLDFLKKQNIL